MGDRGEGVSEEMEGEDEGRGGRRAIGDLRNLQHSFSSIRLYYFTHY